MTVRPQSRRCPVCDATWPTLGSFLSDGRIYLVGLQAIPRVPQASVLVFLHEGCGSISIKASLLAEHLGIAPTASSADPVPCDGCYRDLDELSRCEKPCTIAAEREVTLRVLDKLRGG